MMVISEWGSFDTREVGIPRGDIAKVISDALSDDPRDAVPLLSAEELSMQEDLRMARASRAAGTLATSHDSDYRFVA